MKSKLKGNLHCKSISGYLITIVAILSFLVFLSLFNYHVKHLIFYRIEYHFNVHIPIRDWAKFLFLPRIFFLLLTIYTTLLTIPSENLEQNRFYKLIEKYEGTPMGMLLLGFLSSYLLFFVTPIFLSSSTMQFPQYILAMDPIGIDLKQMLSYSQSWHIAKDTPYIGANLYPPLATVIFTPLLSLKLSSAFKIITFVNVFLFVLTILVLPNLLLKKRPALEVQILVILTGLFSYGFQFELERGQFNLIAVSICFLAIWIYHFHNRYRILAYGLFTISVQLKLFPLIFIVMFVTDWHDWKNNIKRVLMLCAINLALLFALGPGVFVDFIEAIKAQSENPLVWVGNHSIRSFTQWTLDLVSPYGWTWMDEYSGLLQLIFLAIIAVCILFLLLQAYQRDQQSINPYLLLACTIASCLIPPVSHDYKLTILAAPVAILFLDLSRFSKITMPLSKRFIFMVLILVLSTAYSSTLFSYTNKPLLLGNNFPALLTMLLVTSLLSAISTQKYDGEISGTKASL